jgi:flagellar hook-associated protein 1 FlgK
VGDNQTARALANLRDSKVVGGASTLAEGWGTLVSQVGQSVQVAERGQQTHAAIVRQVQALRDAASGVSIDEEATTMLKFQRAYEAHARFFQTINGAIETLLNLV